MTSLRPVPLFVPKTSCAVSKVIAATQWALPQVDIYVGLLTPFASSLYVCDGSSRSKAAGRRLYRHSEPNGGAAFGVSDDAADEEDSGPLHREEAQVRTQNRRHQEEWAPREFRLIFCVCKDLALFSGYKQRCGRGHMTAEFRCG